MTKLFVALLVLVVAATTSFSVFQDPDGICPATTEFDGVQRQFVSKYSYETDDNGVPTLSYMCEYQLTEGRTSMSAADAALPPEKRSTNVQTIKIYVEASYYRDADGKIVKVPDFVPVDVTVFDRSWDLKITDLPSELSLLGIKKMYCGSECFAVPSQDVRQNEAAKHNLKLYFQLNDGTYIVYALYPPPPPQCIIFGIHFVESKDETLLYVHIKDFDGKDKMSVWTVKQSNGQSTLSEVDTLPYVEPAYKFSSYEFSKSGLAALVGADYVSVFDQKDRMIGQATACVTG